MTCDIDLDELNSTSAHMIPATFRMTIEPEGRTACSQPPKVNWTKRTSRTDFGYEATADAVT
jgi:hypothetical protein